MKIHQTPIEGLLVIEPTIHGDNRGFFFESYNEANLRKAGADMHFVQDNRSYSRYGTIRGLHMQKGAFSQTKLVTVLSGEILDVVVDLRKNSKTFKQVYSIKLDSETKKSFLVPKNFLHGFSVLSETAEVMYKVDAFYSKESELGVLYNDKSLNIDWMIPDEKIIVSDKDRTLLSFNEVLNVI